MNAELVCDILGEKKAPERACRMGRQGGGETPWDHGQVSGVKMKVLRALVLVWTCD